METLGVLTVRLAMAVERGEITATEATDATETLAKLFAAEDPTDILTALENAIWMDKTVHEVGHPAPHMAPGEPLGIGYVYRDGKLVAVDHATGDRIDTELEAPSVKRTRPVREGVDNDGLNDAEATEALDEQV